VLAAPSAPGASAPATTLVLHAPPTVHVNKTYRVRATGTASRRLSLAVFIKTGSKKCSKQPLGEAKASAYPAISPSGPVNVGPGDYEKRSDKLTDTKANGHDRICGYLRRYDAAKNAYTVVKRAGLKIASKQ
jgi:hypothetical protein